VLCIEDNGKEEECILRKRKYKFNLYLLLIFYE
jgi:hypothetical protein